MHKLEKEKTSIFKLFAGGDIFINFNEKTGTVNYLENLPTINPKNKKEKKKCNLVCL